MTRPSVSCRTARTQLSAFLLGICLTPATAADSMAEKDPPTQQSPLNNPSRLQGEVRSQKCRRKRYQRQPTHTDIDHCELPQGRAPWQSWAWVFPTISFRTLVNGRTNGAHMGSGDARMDNLLHLLLGKFTNKERKSAQQTVRLNILMGRLTRPKRGISERNAVLYHSGFCPEPPTMKRMEAVAYINHVMRTIDWARMEAALAAEDDGGLGDEICSVSLQEWEHYVRTENQCKKSRAFSWYDGKVYLVEPNMSPHGSIVSEINYKVTFTAGFSNNFLSCSGSSYVESMRLLEPDTSFGPTSLVLGAERPPRMTWGEYHTLKVEVGVARGWPKLDRRAEEWSHFPGVQYVLCVRVSNDLKTRQYRLDSVVDGHIETPRAPIVDIVNPTTVTFDSRRLLGLPPDAAVPLGFSDPVVAIDLFKVIKRGVGE